MSQGVRFSVQDASWGKAAYNTCDFAASGLHVMLLVSTVPPVLLLFAAYAAVVMACTAVVSARATKWRDAQKRPPRAWLRVDQRRGREGLGTLWLNTARNSCYNSIMTRHIKHVHYLIDWYTADIQ